MQQSSRVFFLFACLKACFRLSLSTRNKKKRTITSKKHAYRPETSSVLYYSLNKIELYPGSSCFLPLFYCTCLTINNVSKCIVWRWVSPRHYKYTVEPMLVPSGNPIKCHGVFFKSLQPLFQFKCFDDFSPWLSGGCSEGLDAFRFLFKLNFCWCNPQILLRKLYESLEFTAIFSCTGTAVLEFNYAGEACENCRTPSFWKEGCTLCYVVVLVLNISCRH